MNENFRYNNKSVGENIRYMRHKYGWSQGEAANRLGISVPAFSKIETGVTDVNLSRLEQIANMFQINITNIFLLKPDEAESELSTLHVVQQKIQDREAEITHLQSKVILLYEQLRKRSVSI